MNVPAVMRDLTFGMQTGEVREAMEILAKELAGRESSLEGASLGVRAAHGGNQAEPSLRASTVMDDDSRLKWIFTYHDDPSKAPKYTAIRIAGRNFAEVILMNVDPCADRTLALRAVREAVIWANAALALDGVSF